MFYRCFNADCQKITPLFDTSGKSCPFCGSKNGKIISKERVEEGLEAGVFFNIDPLTGKRAKRKK